MKPTFALDLSRDMIALLHRTEQGWYTVGEVGFDDAVLGDSVDYLRKTALGLSPLGMATKIVLPASQILYTDIHAPGTSVTDKRHQIAAALEGRTPYPVEELVFDWSGTGPTVHVAVIARETLDEAEAFAVKNRLNPVSFVAIPEPGSFVGEVWFGPTKAASGILAAGETVERDSEPVVILRREIQAPKMRVIDPVENLPDLEQALNAELPLSGPDPVAETANAAVAATGQAAAEADLFTPDLEDEGDSLRNGFAPEQARPETEASGPAVEAQIEEAPFAEVPPDDADELEAALEAAALQAALSEDILLKEMALQQARAKASRTPAVGRPLDPGLEPFTPARAGADLQAAPDVMIADASLDAGPSPDEAQFPDIFEGTGVDEVHDGQSAEVAADLVALGDVLPEDVPQSRPTAAMLAFASRRAGATTPPAALDGRAAAPAARAATPAMGPVSARPVGPKSARLAPARGATGLITATKIPGSRAKAKGRTPDALSPGPSGQPGGRSPLPVGGTFGMAKPRRNRTGLVFMVLVGLLLASLAVVAVWSSLSSNNPESATATIPGVEDEMLADMQDPEVMSDPIPEAAVAADAQGDVGALATETGDPTILESQPLAMNLAEEEATDLPPGTLADPSAEASGPAPNTAIKTDISAVTAPVEDQDQIFLSAMDTAPSALDALAMPPPTETIDSLPDAPIPPPAFGTVYQFDVKGLLLPTADGILSPDGVMLIADKPPLVPPVRSDSVAAAGAAFKTANPPDALPNHANLVTGGTDSAAAVLPDGGTPAADAAPPVDPALAAARPRPRPETLLPGTGDDAKLATDEDASALASVRPLPRPESVLAAASASRPAEVAGVSPTDLGAQGALPEADLAAAMALEASDPSIVAISMRPMPRPRDFSNAVEAAVAAAAREPEPEAEIIEVAAAPAGDLKDNELAEVEEPEVVDKAPSIPTKASVAKQATYANAINLSKMNLIGTYGTSSNRYALIRQSNGRYKKVEVGDKIDGGQIEAITETEVRYQKNGKLISLKMPKA